MAFRKRRFSRKRKAGRNRRRVFRSRVRSRRSRSRGGRRSRGLIRMPYTWPRSVLTKFKFHGNLPVGATNFGSTVWAISNAGSPIGGTVNPDGWDYWVGKYTRCLLHKATFTGVVTGSSDSGGFQYIDYEFSFFVSNVSTPYASRASVEAQRGRKTYIVSAQTGGKRVKFVVYPRKSIGVSASAYREDNIYATSMLNGANPNPARPMFLHMYVYSVSATAFSCESVCLDYTIWTNCQLLYGNDPAADA